MKTAEDKQNRVLHVAIAFFLPAAILALVYSFHLALLPERGQDFQWSGAAMVLHHVDPWKQMLAGDRHLILLNQVPNYLHETYLLLAPYAMLTFPHARVAWAITNCLLSLSSMLLLGRYFALGSRLTLLLVSIFFTGYPFRTSLGNGQQNFLELLAFCCAFCLAGSSARGLALGIAYVKYNFAPVAVFYLVFRRQWRILLVSLVLPALGLLGVWGLVRGPLVLLALEPFRVSRSGIVVTAADLMALTRWLGSYVLAARPVEALSYLVGILGSAAYSFHLARSTYLTPRATFTCLATSSLILMRHGFYDFIFLAVPLANMHSFKGTWARIVTGMILAYFWYGERLAVLASVPLRMVVDLLLVGVLLFLVETEDRKLTDAVHSPSLASPATA